MGLGREAVLAGSESLLTHLLGVTNQHSIFNSVKQLLITH